MLFRALDAGGDLLGTFQTSVSLEAGGSRVVVAPAILVATGRKVASVDVALRPRPLRPNRWYRPSRLVLLDMQIRAGEQPVTVTGRAVNRGSRIAHPAISCSLSTAQGRFAGAGIAYLRDLAPGDRVEFSIVIPNHVGTPRGAVCSPGDH